jgi:hypothetical protein
VAEFFRVLRVQVGVELRLARTTPDQTVVVYSRQTGDFSSNDLKNFRIPEIGHQQCKHTGSECSMLVTAPELGECA